MSYVGPRPDSQIYAQPAIDYFSGNGSTTSFTLSRPVVSTAQMIVSVANVIQNPGSAFTVNGTTLQFTGTPPSGTNNIWVQYQTAVIQVNQPGQGTVGANQMQLGAALANIGVGGLTPSYLSPGAPSWNSSGNLSFNSGYGSVATAYGCRAWVNFNGTGTVAIRASGNVSSITDNGTGDYTVNFATAMPDANYAVELSGQVSYTSLNVNTTQHMGTAPSTSAFRIYTGTPSDGNPVDFPYVHVTFHR